jgi:hypothetical protein
MSDYLIALIPELANRGLLHVSSGVDMVKGSHDGRKALITSLGAGKPWGADQIGQAFDQHYAVAADVLAAWDELCQGVSDFGVNIQAVRDLMSGANDRAYLTQRPPTV